MMSADILTKYSSRRTHPLADLIISGRWIGKSGLYRAISNDVRFLQYIDELSLSKYPVFLIVSYDISSDTTGISIKESAYPKIIALEIKDFKRFNFRASPYKVGFQRAVISDEDYEYKVIAIKEEISRGVIYQVNLTNRFDFMIQGDKMSFFADFYQNQPVPYFFYLIHEDFSLVSGSMELFLTRSVNVLKSMPIKGTSTDRKALSNSVKDKAENLMITDMMRNDIGRVSKIGSVSVPELFRITKYKTLYQMHSTVMGISDKAINEILHCTFPPSSVTGAPKIKAVEVIDSLEPHSRGYYCGCAGLWMPSGDFTLSVLIRTAYGRGNELSYFAGCGIVWDSDPKIELQEMYLKVRAFYPLSPLKP